MVDNSVEREASTADGPLMGVPKRGGWDASLKLSLERRGERTVIARQSHRGPLRIQRPFYPESNGTCHVYVLHPPGGVVGGDILATEVEGSGPGAGLLTTPGAAKLYRSDERWAEIGQSFDVRDAFCLEWFPQETIAFNGCYGNLRTRAKLSRDASYAAWDIVCLGRPACGERFTRGALRFEHSIERAGKLQWMERAVYRAGDRIFDAPWGLAGHAVLGTFVVAAAFEATEDWVHGVRQVFADLEEDPRISATLVSQVLVVRYLGDHAHEATSLFRRAWAYLRPLYMGQSAVAPRIWQT